MKKLKINPPEHFITYLTLSFALHFFLPVIQLIKFPYNLIGSLFILLGIWLNLWTDHLFKKNKTVVKPDETPSVLIISGPFKFTRNPMYVGMFLILLGLSIILGSLTVFITPIIFFLAMSIIYIPVEEQILEKTFGKEFTNYKISVRRWI